MNTILKQGAATVALLAGMAGLTDGAHAAVAFSTFVSAGAINAVEGQNATIAFNYAGNKFVGSVYVGINNLQLYQTDLNGGNVQKFGSPLPEGGGEVVVAASLGQAGFGKGDIYAGPNNKIFMYSNAGGAPAFFGQTDDGSTVRQIFFDPGSSFGGKMIVTTTSGHILTFDSAGNRSLVANVGSDTEGMDIASSKYGKYAGQLIVASEGSGLIKAIKADGTITQLKLASGANVAVSVAETVSVVPLNLGLSGNPLEGFYVANFPVDIKKAGADQFSFANLGIDVLGDAIITSEFGSNSPLWDLHYNGDAVDNFTLTQIGTLPNQSEDGIFVTAERIADVTPPAIGAPEPATLALMGLGLAGLGLLRRRKDA